MKPSISVPPPCGFQYTLRLQAVEVDPTEYQLTISVVSIHRFVLGTVHFHIVDSINGLVNLILS